MKYSIIQFIAIIFCFSGVARTALAIDNPPLEKLYLITDREVYYPGETIWFSGYLVDESLTPSTISSVVHVLLISHANEEMHHVYLQAKGGYCEGDIELSDQLPAGEYQIVAYTNYQLNFPKEFIFNKKLRILQANSSSESAQSPKSVVSSTSTATKPSQQIDVQFFPEGGDLIANQGSIISFKAIDSRGKSIEIEGKIVDQENKEITAFKSSYLGMGMIPMFPQLNHQYKAVVQANNRTYTFDFPKVKQNGEFIHVAEINENTYSARIFTDKEQATLFGFFRGVLLFEQEISSDPKSKLINSKLDDLPSGIVKLVLVDESKTPLAERSFFHFNHSIQQPNIGLEGIVPTNSEQKIRLDSVDVESEIYNLRVVDSRLAEQAQETIQTYMLLSSELHGEIENATAYFDESVPLAHRKKQMDLLMRTQAYTSFLADENEFKFSPELQGMDLKFYIQEYKQYSSEEHPIESNVLLTSLEPYVEKSAKSKEDGLAIFKEVDLTDSLHVLIKANFGEAFKKKKNKIKPIFDPITVGILPQSNLNEVIDGLWRWSNAQEEQEITEAFADRLSDEWRINSTFQDQYLESIEVIAKKEDPRFEDSMVKNPSKRVLSEEYPQAIYLSELLMAIPGVRVIGSGTNASVQIRGVGSVNGGGEPLFLIDGMPTDREFVMSYPVYDVDYIDVLKGARSALYGIRGSTGVIAIFSKKGSKKLPKNWDKLRGVLNTVIPSYHKTKVYYNPMFTSDELKRKAYSGTLHWQGIMSNSVSFPTPDFSGKYIVIVEGINKNREPIYLKQSFYVE